jgi:hypothetical protein
MAALESAGPALRLFVSALRSAAFAACLAIAGCPAFAQDAYPSRRVKLIAPQAPGGGVDLVARHVRVTLDNGDVSETSQDYFRGGRDAPLGLAALEAKFIANCRYGGWTADRAGEALAVLRALPSASRIDLNVLRG